MYAAAFLPRSADLLMARCSRIVRWWLVAASVAAGVAFATDGAPVQGRKLVVASWNMAWLADLRAPDFWHACRSGAAHDLPRGKFPPCDAYQRQGIGDAAGYEATKLKAVRAALAEMAARGVDVLALQEVQGPVALARVLPAGYRIACFTSRDDALNLAFVVRRTFDMDFGCREYAALSLEDNPAVAWPVRRGLELTLRGAGREIALLNVHLKAACPRGRMDDAGNAACRVLQAQAAPLEQWIEQQALAGRVFMVIGDWNRDLEQEVRGGFPARSDGSDPRSPVVAAQVRNLFAEINDGDPPQSAMEIAKIDRSAALVAGCHEVLDHLVVGETMRRLLDPASLDDGRVAGRLVRVAPAASDHCMLETPLMLK